MAAAMGHVLCSLSLYLGKMDDLSFVTLNVIEFSKKNFRRHKADCSCITVTSTASLHDSVFFITIKYLRCVDNTQDKLILHATKSQLPKYYAD